MSEVAEPGYDVDDVPASRRSSGGHRSLLAGRLPAINLIVLERVCAPMLGRTGSG
jgi:hypothetical protein